MCNGFTAQVRVDRQVLPVSTSGRSGALPVNTSGLARRLNWGNSVGKIATRAGTEPEVKRLTLKITLQAAEGSILIRIRSGRPWKNEWTGQINQSSCSRVDPNGRNNWTRISCQDRAYNWPILAVAAVAEEVQGGGAKDQDRSWLCASWPPRRYFHVVDDRINWIRLKSSWWPLDKKPETRLDRISGFRSPTTESQPEVDISSVDDDGWRNKWRLICDDLIG